MEIDPDDLPVGRQTLSYDKPTEYLAAGEKVKCRLSIREVVTVLEDYSLDPVAEIVKVLPELDAPMRARTLLGLMEYVHPKKARLEHTGAGGKPLDASVTVTFVRAGS